MTYMMFQFEYVEGAVPGKSLKHRTILSKDEQNQRKKKYEENLPNRKFNKNRKKVREWLQYDEFTKFALIITETMQVCRFVRE